MIVARSSSNSCRLVPKERFKNISNQILIVEQCFEMTIRSNGVQTFKLCLTSKFHVSVALWKTALKSENSENYVLLGTAY